MAVHAREVFHDVIEFSFLVLVLPYFIVDLSLEMISDFIIAFSLTF